MQNTSTTTTRFIAAFLLAVLLSLAGEGTALAFGYGTGSCSVWQSIKSAMTGVYCGYL